MSCREMLVSASAEFGEKPKKKEFLGAFHMKSSRSADGAGRCGEEEKTLRAPSMEHAGSEELTVHKLTMMTAGAIRPA